MTESAPGAGFLTVGFVVSGAGSAAALATGREGPGPGKSRGSTSGGTSASAGFASVPVAFAAANSNCTGAAGTPNRADSAAVWSATGSWEFAARRGECKAVHAGTFDRFRRAAVVMLPDGHIQREGPVVHVVTNRLADYADGRAPVEAKSRDFR